MRFISRMIKNVANDIVLAICIFSLLIYKGHLDLMTSCKYLIDGKEQKKINKIKNRMRK
jgi:hypothetical protein